MKENLLLLKDSLETLKNNIYKYMTLTWKHVYIDTLDDIVNKYNKTYHSIIKMKPIDVKSSTYINSSKETNDKDHKFKVGDIVKILKNKNIFAKGFVPNWSEEVFLIKKLKSDLKGKEIVGTFYEKELQKTNRKEFRVEKVIKRKDNKLYVKWEGYNSSFNSGIVKKGIV